MKLHFALYLLGSLTLVAAAVAQYYHNEAKASRDREEHERSQAALVARIAEVTSVKTDYLALREELLRHGQLTSQQLQEQERKRIEVEGLEQRIREALGQIPADIQSEERTRLAALDAEAKAQKLAWDINEEFRPRTQQLADLVHQVIEEAARGGLVSLAQPTTPMRLPPQVVHTWLTIEENSIPVEDRSVALRAVFDQSSEWLVYLKRGLVRSPDLLVQQRWQPPTDRYYPMLRIGELIKGSETMLATIWFHQETKELRVEHNSRGLARPSVKEKIEQFGASLKGNELVAAVVVELLKETRLRARS